MKKFLILNLIFLLSFSTCVSAEEAIVQKMDFKEAILTALENNNEIRAMKKSLNATEKDIGIRRSAYLPKVALGEDFLTTNSPADTLVFRLNQSSVTAANLAIDFLNNPGNLTTFITYGRIEQVIFDKRAIVEIGIAKKQYSANGYAYLREEEDLIKNVANAYIAIFLAQDLISVLEQDLKDKNEQFKIAQGRDESSKGLYSETLELQTQIASTEQRIVSAKRSLLVAKRALGLLLGRQETIEISDVAPKLTLKKQEYYKEYSLYRNDVKAMEISVETAKENIKLAQSDWYPKLVASASYNFYNRSYPFGATGQFYNAGAFLKWYLFDGNKRVWETRKARDKSGEAKELLLWLRKTVDFKVFEAYLKVEEAMQNFDISSAALKGAEEGKRLVEDRWKQSLVKYASMEEAQTNLDNARENLVRSSNDLKTQLINLYYESGTIKKELEL